MRKLFLLFAMCGVVMGLSACALTSKCETEPIVEENHKLIVPPNFGKMPG